MLCLAAASLGCVELQYADVSPDAVTPRDVVDAADVRDVADVPRDTPADTADGGDVMDAADVRDAADVLDARDVPDVPDVRDVVDVLDMPDVRDVVDVPDVPDVPDVRDVVDVLDVPDVRDVPDAPDVVVLLDAPSDRGPRDDVPADAPPFTNVPASLSVPTASISQPSYTVAEAIDGFVNNEGWGIGGGGDGGTGTGRPQTAAFEFTTDTPLAPRGTRLVVTLHHNLFGGYRLGRFRLSVTNASRSSFCDGRPNGGDTGASAIWSVPAIFSPTATTATLTPQGDGSILASNGLATTVYTVTLETTLPQLTGLRIEALTDPSLPNMGPGWNSMSSDRGNFVLTEISVTVSSR
jgi:hypothetical protein